MSDLRLREEMLRLAHRVPALRRHLVPLIKAAGGSALLPAEMRGFNAWDREVQSQVRKIKTERNPVKARDAADALYWDLMDNVDHTSAVAEHYGKEGLAGVYMHLLAKDKAADPETKAEYQKRIRWGESWAKGLAEEGAE